MGAGAPRPRSSPGSSLAGPSPKRVSACTTMPTSRSRAGPDLRELVAERDPAQQVHEAVDPALVHAQLLPVRADRGPGQGQVGDHRVGERDVAVLADDLQHPGPVALRPRAHRAVADRCLAAAPGRVGIDLDHRPLDLGPPAARGQALPRPVRVGHLGQHQRLHRPGARVVEQRGLLGQDLGAGQVDPARLHRRQRVRQHGRPAGWPAPAAAPRPAWRSRASPSARGSPWSGSAPPPTGRPTPAPPRPAQPGLPRRSPRPARPPAAAAAPGPRRSARPSRAAARPGACAAPRIRVPTPRSSRLDMPET